MTSLHHCSSVKRLAVQTRVVDLHEQQVIHTIANTAPGMRKTQLLKRLPQSCRRRQNVAMTTCSADLVEQLNDKASPMSNTDR